MQEEATAGDTTEADKVALVITTVSLIEECGHDFGASLVLNPGLSQDVQQHSMWGGALSRLFSRSRRSLSPATSGWVEDFPGPRCTLDINHLQPHEKSTGWKGVVLR